MAVKEMTFGSREEWLKARGGTIGASDAPAIVGASPYKTREEFFELKTRKAKPIDLSGYKYVKFGIFAEAPLRYLFALEYKDEYKVWYKPNNMYKNDKYPWAHYSSDGILYDQKDRKGILEIKTDAVYDMKEFAETVVNKYYYYQVLHAMAVADAEFAVIKIRIKLIHRKEEPYGIEVFHKKIERKDVEEDIKKLMEAEKEFFEDVKKELNKHE